MTAQERLDAILVLWNELVDISNNTPATPEEVIRLEDALDTELEAAAIEANHPPGTPKRTRP